MVKPSLKKNTINGALRVSIYFRFHLLYLRNKIILITILILLLLFLPVPPSVVEKVEAEPVQHAESRQQKLSWEYGDLGDSNEEDVYVRVKYCTPKRCRTMDFNGTSGVLEKLSRKTKYTYTVQVLDRTFMKFSKVSVAKEFTTEEKGKALKY